MLSHFFCRDVIALVSQVLPVYSVFHVFEAVCVSTTLIQSLTPCHMIYVCTCALPKTTQGCEDELVNTREGLTV